MRMRFEWRGVWLGAALMVVGLAGAHARSEQARRPKAPAVLWLPLVVHVAPALPSDAKAVPTGDEAVPVVTVPDRAWIDARVAEANRVFTPFGVAFTVQAVLPLAARYADAASREDRDALAALFSEGAIHVFVVARLMDIHTAGLPRRGVHWKVKRAGRAAPARFVIVAAYSGVGVLAHELGHFLGHPAHTNTPDNLMSYVRTGLQPVFLDAAQGKAMARRAKALLGSGYLKPGVVAEAAPAAEKPGPVVPSAPTSVPTSAGP